MDDLGATVSCVLKVAVYGAQKLSLISTQILLRKKFWTSKDSNKILTLNMIIKVQKLDIDINYHKRYSNKTSLYILVYVLFMCSSDTSCGILNNYRNIMCK